MQTTRPATGVSALPERLTWLWQRFTTRFRDEEGAVAIEYVIVAVALLAVAGAIAAALTTLGNDAVTQIPASVADAGGDG